MQVVSERDEQTALPRGARRHGIGLRTQILVVLGFGFALGALLLGVATSQLGSRALDAERLSVARGLAQAFLTSALEPASLEALIGTAGIVGAELRRGGEPLMASGRRRGAASIEVHHADSRTVSLWIEAADAQRTLSGLLTLYAGLTAAAMLLLTYILLGRSIVRPVEQLTRASERVARRRSHDVRVPVQGPAELARLSVAFNAMQAELAKERSALRARLEELERTTSELAAAQRSLVTSEKLASVGRLAAGVAHEIGNPLSAILGLVELVETGDLSAEQQREFLRRTRREIERIHRIIRDLLDFARDEPHAEAQSCDLTTVVEDAVRLVGPQKDLRQITLERRFAEDAPPARGPAARLTQVVLNLLLNAADAIEGEGTITLEVQPSEPGFVELRVTDTGPGIPPSMREHLFEPFATSKPAGQGTGLGLAVSHTIVERLGGTIEGESLRGGGARFTVRLPIAR